MERKISADELKDRLDSGSDLFLLDTRPRVDYEEWSVEGAVHFPFEEGEELGPDEMSLLRERIGAEPEDEIVTVCARGVTSADLAEKLRDEGFEDVRTLQGGMKAWSGVYDRVPIPTGDEDLAIVQLQRRAKGCLGYLVGSKSSGTAAAFDVSQYSEEFLDAAEEFGLRIVRVFDTHIHADHLSGGRHLSRQLQVPYHLGSGAEERDPGFDFESVEDGDVFRIGEVTVKAVRTPGHTTEMTSWLVEGEGLITGDSLFVDSIGRTELEFEEEADKGASLQYRSLLEKVMVLPEDVKVLPGHFDVSKVGEESGIEPGTPIFSTIGYLKENNRAFEMDEEEFVAFMGENLPSKPPNYDRIIELNLGKGDPVTEEEAIELELGPNRCAASEDSMVD